MNKKMIAAAVVLLGCVCALGLFLFKDFFTTQTGGEYRNMPDLESSYSAEEEIAKAKEKMELSKEMAVVVTGVKTNQRYVALTFDGLADRATLQKVLDTLKKYNAKATFFVDGLQVAEDPQTVANIRKEGQRIENYTLLGLSKMDTLSIERLLNDFCRSSKIVKINTDKGPFLLKCNDTKYTEDVRRVARACGFEGVVRSDLFLDVKQIKASPNANAFVGTVKPGNIISVKLKPNVDPLTQEPGKTNLKPAIDKQPGLKELKNEDVSSNDTAEAVEKLLVALDKARYQTAYVEEFMKKKEVKALGNNGGASLLQSVGEWAASFLAMPTAYAADLPEREGALEMKFITTTEPAVAYTFGGLANETAVDNMLKRLDELGIRGTFFVLEVEMTKQPHVVQKIIAKGHEVGLALRPKENEPQGVTEESIRRGLAMLRERFGVETKLVKQPWGQVTEETKRAVQAVGCLLIGQSINVVQSKHKDYEAAEQVMGEIFGKSVFSLARGQIVHFRMDFYTKTNLAADLAVMIKERKVDNIAYVTAFDNPANNPANDSQFAIKSVGDILKNRKYRYQLPIDMSRVPDSLRRDGQAEGYEPEHFVQFVSQRYIGSDLVTYEDRMFGLSKTNIRRLDQTGLVHTKDNVIFITFDDWGTDAAISKLLYVLEKHKAPAAFFVITHNVLNNPNLLRAIAEQGHTIGSHSDGHQPMSFRNEETQRIVGNMTKEQYKKDYSTSFQKLRSIVGDVVIQGRPALNRYFRPPTLAISRDGMEALFEEGFEYVISGSCSTYDYKAQSVEELVHSMVEGVYTKEGVLRKGAVLVMHMGDSCAFTPVALDILLTANEAKADTDPTKFKVGYFSDYLLPGYSQIDRKKSLKLSGMDKK